MGVLPIWAIWLSLGVILLIAEILTGTFFFFCFGVAAFITTAVVLFGFGQGVQWGVFLAASVGLVFLSRAFAERYSGEPERRAGVDRFIGERAIVIQAVSSLRGTGRVRVLHEEWRVECPSEKDFSVDEVVLIVGVRGTHLIIDSLAEEPQSESAI